MIKRKWGWRRDKLDKRDMLFRIFGEVVPESQLPSSVDLSSKLIVPPFDQGETSSCTSQAISGAIGTIEYDFISSRLFIYFNERALEETTIQDGGAQIRDGIKTVASTGVCPESDWPFIESRVNLKPPPNCYSAAAKDKINSYLKVKGIVEMKSCLAAGFVFVAGISVFDSFESEEVAKTGLVPMPGQNEELLGGHAILVFGYNDSDKTFSCRNSWGSGWGLGGNFKIPQDYLSDPSLCNDCWTIRSAKILK